MTTPHTPLVLSAGSVTGDDVINLAGERLGTIKEIMLDIEHGRVMYAVMSVGGFLGLGDTLFAVPWGALKVDTDARCFILDADKSRLEAAVGFDKDDWPDLADPDFHRGVYSFYGIKPYWEDTAIQRDRMADESPAFTGVRSHEPGGLRT